MIEDDHAMRLLHHDYSFARDAWRQMRLVDAKSKASRGARAGSDSSDVICASVSESRRYNDLR